VISQIDLSLIPNILILAILNEGIVKPSGNRGINHRPTAMWGRDSDVGSS